MKDLNLQLDIKKLIQVANWVAYAKSAEEAQALVLGELRPLLETINLTEQ